MVPIIQSESSRDIEIEAESTSICTKKFLKDIPAIPLQKNIRTLPIKTKTPLIIIQIPMEKNKVPERTLRQLMKIDVIQTPIGINYIILGGGLVLKSILLIIYLLFMG